MDPRAIKASEIRRVMAMFDGRLSADHPAMMHLWAEHERLMAELDAQVLAPFVNRYEGFRALRAEARRFYRQLARDVDEVGFTMDEVKAERLRVQPHTA